MELLKLIIVETCKCLEKHNKNNEIIPFISCHLRRNSRVNEFLNQEMFRKRITVFENSLIEECLIIRNIFQTFGT